MGSIGATAHHFIHQLEQLTGAKFNVVSFKSGADAATAVLGGHVHATAENLGEILPHVGTKKMRLLGIPAGQRLAGLPDVATMKEQGYDLHIGSGRGFASPAGIPREAAAMLEETVSKVYKSSGWQEYMARNMYEGVYMNAEGFARYLAAHHVEMNRFLTEVGLAQKK